ncbi:MAG: translocation/assembly module TamB domain-containing protein [Novosphingobium sp.]|nr:translocation/assembly module TamB domain-containing protein [Novosphingobium sp.]MBO9601562.1 translocation/assembly module TamB domain-containing protein [Novosphingobium sp.]
MAIGRRAKWIGGGVVGLLLVLVLLAGAGLLWLDTAGGHRFIARQIAGLKFENGMTLKVGRLDGSIYNKLTVHDLAVGDPKGIFLSAPEAEVDWRPFAYLSNHVDIRSLAAPLMRLHRTPEFKEVPSEGPLLPDLDIDVARLDIARIDIDKPVTGDRHLVSLKGTAHIADRRAVVNAEARALVADGLKGGDRVAVTLDAIPEKNKLDFAFDLTAPQDGLVASYTGRHEPLTARVQGKGDWKRWDGRFAATIGGDELADVGIAARNGTVALNGWLAPQRLLPAASANMFAARADIDLTTTLANRRADLDGSLRNANFTLAAKGLVDLGANRFEDLKVDFRLLRAAAIAPKFVGDNVAATFALDGAFATPQVDYNIAAARLGFGTTHIVGLTAQGSSRVDADKALVPVHARARMIEGLDAAANQLLTNVRVDGDLAVKWPRILSDNLKIRSDRIDATAVLVADVSSGLYTGGLNGKVGNYMVAGVGRFDITSKLDLKTQGNDFRIAGTITARSREIFNSTAQDFLGGNGVVSARVSYGTDGVARVSSVRLAAPQFRLADGSGSYRSDGAIRFTGRGTSDKYGPLSLDVSGTTTRPVAVVVADRPDFGIGLANLRAELRGTDQGYALVANGASDYGPLEADLAILAGKGPLTIDVRKASLAGIGLTGRVVQSAAGPFAGTLTADGAGVGGQVQLLAAGDVQRAVIALTANNTKLSGPADFALTRAIVNADVTLYEQPQIAADVQVAGLSMAGFSLDRARAQIDYRGGAGSAKLFANGRRSTPFELAVNAQMKPDQWLVAMRGNAGGVGFRTLQPARIKPGKGEYELLPTRLALRDGTVELAGHYGSDLKVQTRLADVDLAVLRPLLPELGLGGTATGSLDFAQRGQDFPDADARLMIKRFTRTSLASVSTPVDVQLVGRLLPEGGNMRAIIGRNGATVGRIQVDLTPLGPQSGSWMTRLTAAPLSGGIRYNGPASVLFSLAALPDQHVAGAIGVAADFSGRVQTPSLTGVVRANDLTYVNDTYGTRLTKLKLRGTFTDDRLEVSELSAVAGNGTVSGSGFISLSSDQSYPLQLELKLDNAKLAQSAGMEARASGTLSIVNNPNQPATIRGRIMLPETRYKIVRQGAAGVRTLTGIRRKSAGALAYDAQPASVRKPKPITGLPLDWKLDIDIYADNRVFVTGMGLESEWSAKIHVGGTSGAPQITGGIDLVRGTLGFAGRSFELQSGHIDFPDASSLNPTLAIVASGDVDDATVSITLSGSANNPRVAFSATPSLPQDEIMARILFGSSIGELSTLQAVQLASSLNALRGGSGGLNPLGVLQSATGIDRLRILGADETSGRGTAVAVGKYITNDIYVEVVTDARGYTATQIEISLTRALSLLSQVGSFGGSNVSLRYRKDY